MGAVGGQAAEQIIAGVVLSERLAVTMYGAIHRAQWAGQRNLRGLVVDPKMLAESSFRRALTDGRSVETATALEHRNIVPTVAVESGGPDVVVVTRGGGRFVTVQDLIAAAKANRGQGGKLPLPVAAAIGKSVVEALAVAHEANVVHGAVHPRSVLVDEDGSVRLGDFVVGRALTTAVAQGADSALWRGLAGYIAPELVVGEDPTPAADVFAVGAMLFTMLSGEVPPGTLHVTPAVERLVQRALDTDVTRRYKHASDLLENLLEAFEDDRWEIADRGEVIKAAGLSRTDENIDDATEDLLASLGNAGVQVTPTRPSMDIRAEAAALRQQKTPSAGMGRLDALLADLDDDRGDMTAVTDERAFLRDPVSELIQLDPRKREAIVQAPARSSTRVPSLDDPDDDDDHTPLPPPSPPRDSDMDLARGGRPNASLQNGRDEAAALDALSGLDEPVRRVSTAAEQAEAAAQKLEIAARRAEQAVRRSSGQPVVAPSRPNLAEIPDFSEQPTPRLKSRALGILSLLVVIGGGVGFYKVYKDQQDDRAAAEAERERRQKEADEKTRLAQNAQADRGTIAVSTTPPDASVWLKLGRSGKDPLFPPLASTQMHRIRIEMDGYQAIDTEILAASWSGKGDERKATANITLRAVAKDKKTGKSLAEPLPARPPNLAVEPTGFEPGEGPLVIETSPPGAEVWLLIGYGNTGVSFPTVAGRAYELRAQSDGFLPGFASISAEEWRDGGDPKVPLDLAKKKATITKRIELLVDPDFKPAEKPKKGS